MATSPKSPLAPGESSTFSIKYNTSHAGEANKKVTLITNDSTQLQAEVHIRGVVKPLYERRPIVISDAEVDSVKSATTRLTNKYPKPLPLKLKVDRDLGVFVAELKEITPGQEYELTATTKPPLTPGRSYAKIVLETGLEDAPEVSVVANVFVPLRAELTPSTLYVTPRQRNPLTHTVRLQYRTDQPLKILEVKTTPPSIKCDITPPHASATPGKTASYMLKLTFSALDEIPEHGAKVEVFTDDPTPEFQHMEVKIVKRVERSSPGAKPPTVGPVRKIGGRQPNDTGNDRGDKEDTTDPGTE